MEINPIFESTLLLKSKKKISLYHTIKQEIIEEIKLDEKDNVVGYGLTKNKSNKVVLVYVLSSGIVNIFDINDMKIIFSKQITSKEVKIVTIGNNYCALSCSGIDLIYVLNISSFETKNYKVTENIHINLLSIDDQGKYLAINEKNNILTINLKTEETKNIITSSEKINLIKFSNDGKILAVNSNMHFVSLYSLNGKLLGMIQLNSSISNFKLLSCAELKESKDKKKEVNRKYFAFSFTPSTIDCYTFNLVDNNDIIASKLTFDLESKNIINSSIDLSTGAMSIFYGDLTKIYSKQVTFAKKHILKEGFIQVKHIDKVIQEKDNQQVTNGNYKVLNDNEVYGNGKTILDLLDNNPYASIQKISKQGVKNTEKGVTLIDSLNASLNNNDNEKFDWVVKQQKSINISQTVKILSPEQIKAFLAKGIERFNTEIQSSLIYWLEEIFRVHFTTLPKEELKSLENVLHSKTMNYNTILEIKSKIDLLNDIKLSVLKSNNKVLTDKKDKNLETNPMLVYYDSEDEEEKEKKNKYKKLLGSATTIEKFKNKQKEKLYNKMEIDNEEKLDDDDQDDIDYNEELENDSLIEEDGDDMEEEDDYE
jgi:hypothetical protein